jgi:outer membrane protein OmpA-like peptidoglycan-associated protein
MNTRNFSSRLDFVKTLLALPILLTPVLVQAQFLDLLKDQAFKAAQKVLEAKPAPSATPAPVPAAAAAAPVSTSDTLPATTSGSATANAAPATLQAYQSYDFVPGDTIVFEDNFDKDEDGEFPAHWNQLDGQGAVNNVAGRRAFALTASGYCQVSPAIKNPQYLSDAWTLEFDAYATNGGAHPILYFYNSDKEKHSYSAAIARVRLGWNNWSDVEIWAPDVQIHQSNPDFMHRDDFLNRWHHFALAYKEGRLKIYVDQYRIYSLQDLKVRPRALAFDSSGDTAHPDLISNVRIANGAGIKIIDKKFTDAKIVTHGINFDNDSAILKPESMGTLNMIVDILKNNPEIKFEVQGHTDNSGSSPHNLSLSQQRAEAVKQQLVSMGVDNARLRTKGLGDTKPLADNNSPEGRANNRRVEFVTFK